MVSYSISDTEKDFSAKKKFLDKMLTKHREDKIACSFGVLKKHDSYSKKTSTEYIYTFQDKK